MRGMHPTALRSGDAVATRCEDVEYVSTRIVGIYMKKWSYFRDITKS